MPQETARQQFYRDAERFISQHRGASELTRCIFRMEREIHDHFHDAGFEEAFCGLMGTWVDEQLSLHPMPDAHLHLRTYSP